MLSAFSAAAVAKNVALVAILASRSFLLISGRWHSLSWPSIPKSLGVAVHIGKLPKLELI